MTDISPDTGTGNRFDWTAPAYRERVRKRRRGETWLRIAGLVSISLAIGFLLLMLVSLATTGYKAFTQTHVTLAVKLDPEQIRSDNIAGSNWRQIMQATLAEMFPDLDTAGLREVRGILSDGAQFMVRDRVVADPSLIGTTLNITVPVSDPFDQLNKGGIDRNTPEANRRLNDAQIAAFDKLVEQGLISTPFNWALFRNADSRFPELAGLKGAFIGSIYLLLVCFAIALPVGIGAAIYLEEFAPKNRFSDLIEININNLAAVPSVVFGLLALAVFLNYFGLMRGSPLVGGLTLALMSLPTIIIATRASLKAVPPSIREAALGIGASRQQVVFHHVLPLAMPGIMTGTIIAMAQAIGETAPLLLIGMNAFITAAPSTPFESATTLPTQIFIWADSPERGFVSRTSAAILVLLAILVMLNGAAIWLRRRFERRW
ncbi:phosphate ABC transporter permease PstA [Rhodobacter calidifons]|uniref:Phosphate transport system permease protein PstA n=1 Tax=Rhodobacter calidifons TaxID=2715277 RepID=A0ABX0GAR4_9RHOB|nr:phosphate ABC transporter permease PstA [Rhodobacter calidifons]NHB78410.1 phosphate ABC transporter permease PstA [Rhodobacter calidifons]